MKFLITTSFLLFNLSVGIGQVHNLDHLLIYKAEAIYKSNQDLDKAVALYQSAFKHPVVDGSNILDAITCATKIKDTSSVVSFMEKGIRIGLDTADYIRLWPNLGNGMYLKNIISKLDIKTNMALYEKGLNPEIFNQLKVFEERDQKYRSDDKINWVLQHKNDSLNWSELKKLTLNLKRLPRYSEIGFDGSENLNILFYHMDKNELEWFLPYIIQNIKDGESNAAHIILYQLDRIGMAEGLLYTISDDYKINTFSTRTKMQNGYYCQSFGEWFTEKGKDGKSYITPIDPALTVAEVNRVRNILWLDDIENKW